MPVNAPHNGDSDWLDAMLWAPTSTDVLRTYTIDSILNDYNNGKVKNWNFNRKPWETWKVENRADFLGSQADRQSTPILVHMFREPTDHGPYQITDGSNRIYALTEFDAGNCSMNTRYGSFWAPGKKPEGKRGTELTKAQYEKFRDREVHVHVWNCNEEIACKRALYLNIGTAMNEGQIANFMLQTTTPRGSILSRINNTVNFHKVLDEHDHSHSQRGTLNLVYITHLLLKGNGNPLKAFARAGKDPRTQLMRNFFSCSHEVDEQTRRATEETMMLVDDFFSKIESMTIAMCQDKKSKLVAVAQIACLKVWTIEGKLPSPEIVSGLLSAKPAWDNPTFGASEICAAQSGIPAVRRKRKRKTASD